MLTGMSRTRGFMGLGGFRPGYGLGDDPNSTLGTNPVPMCAATTSNTVGIPGSAGQVCGQSPYGGGLIAYTGWSDATIISAVAGRLAAVLDAVISILGQGLSAYAQMAPISTQYGDLGKVASDAFTAAMQGQSATASNLNAVANKAAQAALAPYAAFLKDCSAGTIQLVVNGTGDGRYQPSNFTCSQISAVINGSMDYVGLLSYGSTQVLPMPSGPGSAAGHPAGLRTGSQVTTPNGAAVVGSNSSAPQTAYYDSATDHYYTASAFCQLYPNAQVYGVTCPTQQLYGPGNAPGAAAAGIAANAASILAASGGATGGTMPTAVPVPAPSTITSSPISAPANVTSPAQLATYDPDANQPVAAPGTPAARLVSGGSVSNSTTPSSAISPIASSAVPSVSATGLQSNLISASPTSTGVVPTTTPASSGFDLSSLSDWVSANPIVAGAIVIGAFMMFGSKK